MNRSGKRGSRLFAALLAIGASVCIAPSVDAAGWVNGDVAVAVGGVAPGGAVGGKDVTFGAYSIVGQDVIASSSTVELNNYAKALGACVTGGNPLNLKIGAICGSSDTSGTNPDLATLTSAITDLATFETALSGAASTQTIPAVNLADSGTQTISDSVAGLNIISVPSVTLGNSSTLTLSGLAADTLVLNISGALAIGDGAAIRLAGGLVPANVIINVGGLVTAWNASSTLNGTLLALNSACTGTTGITINGAVVCSGSLNFGHNARLNFFASKASISSTTLGTALAFAALSETGDVSFGNVSHVSDNQLASYKVYDNSGNFLGSVFNGLQITPNLTGGCAFNNNGNKLYTTDFTATKLTLYDSTSPHPIDQTLNPGTKIGATSHAESIVFDHAGNFYVGSPDGQKLLKYSSTNVLQTVFSPNVESGARGIDWIDLAPDQCTIFYTSEGVAIRRFNVCTNSQLPDFVGGLSESGAAYGLKLLPDGSVLLADLDEVIRFDSLGNQIQTYTAPGEVGPFPSDFGWFALALDTDGTSFWAASQFTGNFYRFNIATGAIEVGPISSNATSGILGGVCLRGEPDVARTLQSCSSSATQGKFLCN